MPARRCYTPHLSRALMTTMVKPWEAPCGSWWRLLNAHLRRYKLFFVDSLWSCDSVNIEGVCVMLFLCCVLVATIIRFTFWKLSNLPDWVKGAILGLVILMGVLPTNA